MNKKILWGVLFIFIGLFYMFQQYIPDSMLMYIFNYQILLILIGVYQGLRKKTFGWILAGVGVYLYLKEFFYEYFDLGFPIVVLIGGITLLILGITEKNKGKQKNIWKEEAIFTSTKKNTENNEKIEEAEEIK